MTNQTHSLTQIITHKLPLNYNIHFYFILLIPIKTDNKSPARYYKKIRKDYKKKGSSEVSKSFQRKEKKCQYGQEQHKNLHEHEKQRLVANRKKYY